MDFRSTRRTVFFLLLCYFPGLAVSEVKILASIKPLALLANELIAPQDEVETLLPASASPHHYQLKPSDRQKIKDARLVLWIGPEFESFLEKPLKQRTQALLAIRQLEEIIWPKVSETKHDHHDHDYDPHLWLNPQNLLIISEALVVILSDLSPQQAPIYRRNGLELQERLKQMDQRLRQKLAPVVNEPFVVLHPAYNHFVQHYRLNQREYLVLTPESTMSAKHRYKLQKSESIVCVFGEVGANTTLVDALADQLQAKVGVLDPLGVQLKETDSTTALLKQLATDMVECLGPA